MTLRPVRGRHREKLALWFRVYTRDRQKSTPRQNDSREHVTAVRVDAHRILLFFMLVSLVFPRPHTYRFISTHRGLRPRAFPSSFFKSPPIKLFTYPLFYRDIIYCYCCGREGCPCFT